MTEHYIEDSNLSHAWGRALKIASRPGSTEQVPLVVSITGFENSEYREDQDIRSALDKVLNDLTFQSVKTVGGTIFPVSLWNSNSPRSQLFSRYERMVPRLQSIDRRNSGGLYFQRMITDGPKSEPNQLEFILNTFLSRKGVRRSTLQIAIYNPHIDLTASARLGFPCMQHLTFTPTENGGLSVNAFYADQYLIAKAYGNYIGLCDLGKFVAHELGLRLERVTCYAGIAQLGVTKTQIKPLLQVIDRKLATRT